MRPFRFLGGAQEHGESTVDITAKTLQGRFLLKPDPHVSSIIAGVLARAKERYGVEIHGYVVMSSHMHLMITVDGVKTMSRFMQYVMSNVARKVGRYYGWRGRFWHRRYRGIEIHQDEATLLSRFDYLLRHGTKEGLVPCPTEWPGLHCAWSYAQNQWDVRGHWDDLTRAYQLRSAGKRVRRRDVRSETFFTLDPLPCWRHLDRATIRLWVLERLAQIREEYSDLEFLGARKVLKQSIEDQALNPKRSPAPAVHCKCPKRRKEMRDAIRKFAKAFYAAAARLDTVFKPADDPLYESVMLSQGLWLSFPSLPAPAKRASESGFVLWTEDLGRASIRTLSGCCLSRCMLSFVK